MIKTNRAISIAIFVALTLTLLPALPTAATAPSPELSTSELIVRFQDSDDAARFDGRQLGRGMVLLEFDTVQEASRAFEELRTTPGVLSVEENRQLQLAWAPTTEAGYEEQRDWVEQVNLPDAWNVTTGQPGIVVAVVDSGVSPTHPDLQDRLVPGYNAVDASANTADIDGHGTHIAGIIAANGRNGVGTAGAGMDVSVMPIQVVAPDDSITNASIAAGVNWAVDNGADVINISISDEHPSPAIHAAVQYAYEQGIPVVSASGNNAIRMSYPASHPEAISVGSLDANGDKSHFSSAVSRVDVAAPGELIFSPAWNDANGDHWSDQIEESRSVTGTSFSTAIVSGFVALIRSINPDLTPEDIRAVLTGTAVDSGAPGLEAGVGAGQIDAEAGLRQVAFIAMHDTWRPADYPVSTGQVSRTWLWGVDPPPHFAYETYDEAQDDIRLVYYFDKSRMEITNPLGDRSAIWYVTNGLLVVELISGEMQVGDQLFDSRQPASVNIAGDPDDVLGPTYAAFNNVLDEAPLADGTIIDQTISRDGVTGSDPAYGNYGVTAAHLEPITNHQVASVFWEYLNSTGPISQGDQLVESQLFDPWFYATGLPVTEAYWATVKVAGIVQDVLIQCFERRCLTYTPANVEGWQVEMGNVGMHYYTWRYDPGSSNGQEPPDTGIPTTGETVYQTDFSDWPNQTFAEGTTFRANGGYHIRVTTPDVFIPQLATGFDGSDFSASVTVQSISGISFSQGCIAYRVAGAFAENYAFCLAGDGKATVVHEQDDGAGGVVQTPLIELQQAASLEAVAAGVELEVIASGSRMWFFVGGALIGEVTHESGPVSGALGVYVHNISGGTAEFKFSNLVVRSIS